MDFEGGHYGDGNTFIVEDTTSDRCIMVGNVAQAGVTSGVETGTLTFTEQEQCRGIGNIGLQWPYSYSLDYATGVLSLSTTTCVTGNKQGGGTMTFH